MDDIVTRQIAADGGQRNTYTEVVRKLEGSSQWPDRKPTAFEITIGADFYKRQSWAKISVWSDKSLQWEKVHAISPENMQTEYKRTCDLVDFEDDRDELLRIAEIVVLGTQEESPQTRRRNRFVYDLMNDEEQGWLLKIMNRTNLSVKEARKLAAIVEKSGDAERAIEKVSPMSPEDIRMVLVKNA